MLAADKGGWGLVALDAPVDTTTPQGAAMAQVLAVFAELERRLIGERTKAALAVKRAQRSEAAALPRSLLMLSSGLWTLGRLVATGRRSPGISTRTECRRRRADSAGTPPLCATWLWQPRRARMSRPVWNLSDGPGLLGQAATSLCAL